MITEEEFDRRCINLSEKFKQSMKEENMKSVWISSLTVTLASLCSRHENSEKAYQDVISLFRDAFNHLTKTKK